MSRKLLVLGAVCATFLVAGTVKAQKMDSEMEALAGKIGATLSGKGFKSVATTDFTDLQGKPTELGRFLSEQLTVAMVSSAGVSMVDRANIKSILAEHKLTEEGLVNPANAKKLGEFAGVDAIVIGNATEMDDTIVLVVKAISTQSAGIIAAGKISFDRTPEMGRLGDREVSAGSLGGGSRQSPTGIGPRTYVDLKAIATKDAGALRFTLKSVLPMNVTIDRRQRKALQCSLDIYNLETKRPVALALVAQSIDCRHGDTALSGTLASEAVDDRGGVWKGLATTAKGVSVVGPGCYIRNTQWNECVNAYLPTDIAKLLMEQGQERSDCPALIGTTMDTSPGETVPVTLQFIESSADDNDKTKRISGKPEHFQLDVQVVVGIDDAKGKRNYTTKNITFDRITMPAF